MRRRSGVGISRAVLIAALAVCLLGTAGGARAQPVQIGIGDQSWMSLTDARLAVLGTKTARIVLPWDVAAADPWRVALWMQQIEEHGMEPYVAFGASSSDRCPGSPCVLPSYSQYRAAFDQFHGAFPSIRLFTAWNEPNHAREPTAHDPAAAAHYADVVAQECPGCAVVAGDLLDGPGMLTYLNFYKAALTIKPAAWGLHNYYDTTYFQPTGTDAFLAGVDGPVWLTESGGIVTWRSSDGAVQLTYDEQRAAASLSYGLRLASDRAGRIERMYVYQWRAAPSDDFDAGLLRPDGSERPALAVLRSALGLPASVTLTGNDEIPVEPAAIVAPPPPSKARVVLGPARLGRGGRLRVRVRCMLGPCRGRLTIEGSGRIAQRFVNGRTVHGTLRPVRRAFALARGARTTMRVSIPAAVRRRAGRAAMILKMAAVPLTIGDFVAVRRVIRFPRSLQISP